MKVLKLSLILFLSLSSFTYCLGPLIKPISLYYFIAKLFEPEVNENEAQNQENESQNQENESQNQENESQNQENEAQNQENEAQNQENEAQNQENEAQNQESIFGQIDPSFGDGGYKIFDIPGVSLDFAESLVLKGDKILQGGYCNNLLVDSIFCLVQYDVSGNVDSSFGSGGYVTFDIHGSTNEYNTSLALQGDKIIQSGGCYTGSSKFCLVRYKADGSLDTSFNFPLGYRIYDIPTSPSDYARALAIQTNGYILQGGVCQIGSNHNFCLTRYNPNGDGIDFSFIPNIIPEDSDIANALALQGNKILQSGFCENDLLLNSKFCVMRYNSDGAIDSGFGSGGYVLYDIPVSNYDDANSLIVQSDGKIIQGGTCTISGTDQFCIVRYNADGSVDSTFGTSGYMIFDIPDSSDDQASAIALQTNGKILQGGTCTISGTFQFCIVRYNVDGSIDSTFGTNGYFIYQVPGTTWNTLGRSIVIQSDGKILLGGTCDNKFCIVKIQ
jgi:uncharacterized delta-60 repeat protein